MIPKTPINLKDHFRVRGHILDTSWTRNPQQATDVHTYFPTPVSLRQNFLLSYPQARILGYAKRAPKRAF